MILLKYKQDFYWLFSEALNQKVRKYKGGGHFNVRELFSGTIGWADCCN